MIIKNKIKIYNSSNIPDFSIFIRRMNTQKSVVEKYKLKNLYSLHDSLKKTAENDISFVQQIITEDVEFVKSIFNQDKSNVESEIINDENIKDI